MSGFDICNFGSSPPRPVSPDLTGFPGFPNTSSPLRTPVLSPLLSPMSTSPPPVATINLNALNEPTELTQDDIAAAANIGRRTAENVRLRQHLFETSSSSSTLPFVPIITAPEPMSFLNLTDERANTTTTLMTTTTDHIEQMYTEHFEQDPNSTALLLMQTIAHPPLQHQLRKLIVEDPKMIAKQHNDARTRRNQRTTGTNTTTTASTIYELPDHRQLEEPENEEITMAKAAVHGESYLLALIVESQNFVAREIIANSCMIRTFSNLLFVPRNLKDFVPSDPEEESRAFDAIFYGPPNALLARSRFTAR